MQLQMWYYNTFVKNEIEYARGRVIKIIVSLLTEFKRTVVANVQFDVSIEL